MINRYIDTFQDLFGYLFLLFSLSSDLFVPVSDISLSGRLGLLPHLRQILPRLQRGAGICRLDLICCFSRTEDSREPQQTS